MGRHGTTRWLWEHQKKKALTAGPWTGYKGYLGLAGAPLIFRPAQDGRTSVQDERPTSPLWPDMTHVNGTVRVHERKNGYAVQALDRAFRILELLAESPATATEIAGRLALHRSTVFRMLSNLEQRGYVRRDEMTGAYSLGIKLFQLGTKALQEEFPIHRLHPVLAELAETTGQTAQLWLRSGFEALCLDQVEPPRDFRVVGRVGRRLPLNSGAVSKVLLAFATPVLREQFLAGPLTQLNASSVDPEALRAELDMVRFRGFAVSDGAIRISSKAVAAPVFNALGEVELAVCILAPAEEVHDGNLQDIASAVMDAARRLSHILGYFPGNGGQDSGADRSVRTPLQTDA